MGRKEKAPLVIENNVDHEALEEAAQSVQELHLLNQQATDAAKEMALQIGYDGALNVGAVEDEIRFYQRQTVQACLELGKRLLVLKELTPHGEFEKRIDLLGFSKSTAHRFMQTTFKTIKSPNLALLSTQVKNMSAFLELVTQDDDVLEAIAEMDEVDRMSASELRAALRDLREDKKATEEVLAKRNRELDKLQSKQSRLKPLNPDEEGKALLRETSDAVHQAEAIIRGVVRDGLEKLQQHGVENDMDFEEVSSGFLNQLKRSINELHATLDIKMVTDGDPTPEWKK